MSKRAADIVFLLDITGSMQPCIDALQENISNFIDFLSADDANNEQPVKDWRGKIVGYRDAKHDGDSWFEDNDFVRDADSLKRQLNSMSASGGGDEPESLLDAIYRVGSLGSCEKGFQEDDPKRWRYIGDAARVVVIFTDASFHPTMSIPEAAGGTIADVTNLCATEKLLLTLFAPRMSCHDDIGAIEGAQYKRISKKDEDPREGLTRFTSDQANFKTVLEQLAKSISSSSNVELL